MIITAFNPLLDNQERTFLTNSYSLGATSVEVKNNDEFANNDRILIGEMGLEQSEIVTAGTPNANGTTMPIGTTLFPHEANTPVYRLLYDQVKFYRSTTGINGTYTAIATVSLDVDASTLQTVYNDTSAQTGYYYKVSMFNSLSLVESALSDAIPATTGWATTQVGYTIDQIYREVSDPNEQFLTRDELFGYFNEVNDELIGQVARPYRFLYTRQVFGRTANTLTLNYPTDSLGNQTMWKFDRIDYNYVDNTTTPVTNRTYTIEVLPLDYFRNRHTDNTISSSTVSDQVQEIALDDATKQFDYFPASKTTSSSVFYLYYWAYFTRISSEGQYFQTWTPLIYKLKALAKFYRKRSIAEPNYLALADRYETQYQSEKARYKSHDRQDQGTPRRFVREDSITRSFRR